MEELLQGKSITAEIDEQIVFNQLNGGANAVWSLLLATGYLKVLGIDCVGEFKQKVYTLALTNLEVRSMFVDMVKGWFDGSKVYKELLRNNLRYCLSFSAIALHKNQLHSSLCA